MSQPRSGSMFPEDRDENGVEYSHNAHPVSEYDPRPIKSQFPHLMWSDEEGKYIEPPARRMEHAVKDQVLQHIGSRTGTMAFESELEMGTPKDGQRGNGINPAVPVPPRTIPTRRGRGGR